MSQIKARSRKPMIVVASIALMSCRASAGSSTGVLPRRTMWSGPRTAAAGLAGNAHTRRAYARAATEFFDWLAGKGVAQLAGIESIHVAAYIEELSRARS